MRQLPDQRGGEADEAEGSPHRALRHRDGTVDLGSSGIRYNSLQDFSEDPKGIIEPLMIRFKTDTLAEQFEAAFQEALDRNVR